MILLFFYKYVSGKLQLDETTPTHTYLDVIYPFIQLQTILRGGWRVRRYFCVHNCDCFSGVSRPEELCLVHGTEQGEGWFKKKKRNNGPLTLGYPHHRLPV